MKVLKQIAALIEKRSSLMATNEQINSSIATLQRRAQLLRDELSSAMADRQVAAQSLVAIESDEVTAETADAHQQLDQASLRFRAARDAAEVELPVIEARIAGLYGRASPIGEQVMSTYAQEQELQKARVLEVADEVAARYYDAAATLAECLAETCALSRVLAGMPGSSGSALFNGAMLQLFVPVLDSTVPPPAAALLNGTLFAFPQIEDRVPAAHRKLLAHLKAEGIAV